MTFVTPATPTSTASLTYDILTVDKILGVTMATLAFAGVLGNVVSLYYFYTNKGKDRLHDILYCLMCLIDLTTCLTSLPVIYTRLSTREPGLFSHPTFCGTWAVVFRFSVVLSLFNVVLISLSRTIAILKPLYRVQVRAVLASFLGFGGLMLLFDVVLVLLKVISFTFFREVGFCVVIPGESELFVEDTLYKIWDHGFVPISALVFNGALLVVFLSFIFSLISLLRRTANTLAARKASQASSKQTRSFKRVTVTITLFTAVFILCNLPTVVNSVINLLVARGTMGHGGLFWFFNSDFLLRVFSNVLNGCLNPVIYLWRMPNFKKWVRRMGANYTRVKTNNTTCGVESQFN